MKQWMKPEVVNLTINKTDEDGIEKITLFKLPIFLM